MAIIILAHPHYMHSIANKSIVDEITRLQSDIEVRNLFQLYPDYQINVEAEQAALLKHDTIILQYPMYWFNMPAILKLWFDEVFSYQFAYGAKGDKLKNKKVIISMTVGQSACNFINDGENLMESFLKPVNQSIQYTQMELDGTFLLHDVSSLAGHSETKIRLNAVQHGKNILNHLSK